VADMFANNSNSKGKEPVEENQSVVVGSEEDSEDQGLCFDAIISPG
jgi:hypothetical protein